MDNVRQWLSAGETLYGTMLVEFHTPNVAVLLKACGFDCFIIDCEHGYFDYGMVANIATVARGAGIPAVVRIPGAEREAITKYLDMGAAGLLLPQVDDPEQLRAAVACAKYAPEGRRGVSTTRAHTGYGVADLPGYMREANRRTAVLAQIESRAGLERLDEIAGVPGLDALIVGPNDLAQDLGIAGSPDHPLMQEAIARVAAAACRCGIRSGIIASQLDLLQRCAALGMTFLSWNSEVGMLMRGAKDGLGRLKAGGVDG